MAHQLEQLLTCCICLDRFSNPKLLPCQHSVCMEPCMEGLVDYVRRQVKCPECRAEHRIPYNGVQGFPTNVTLQRFLEAHIEITGEAPDPHTGQYMERCSVCNEKEYLSLCAHCEKKICVGCKSAHTDILKREIGRINNQVKRAAHRLNDQLGTVERSITALKQNTTSVTEEIENISQRLQKAIRDRCNFLKQEVENSSNSEHRSLQSTKEGMEQEVSNIEANIELAEKHMDDKTPWDDCELMDTKDIFLKTMEFIRSFDYEPGDHKRTKFQPPDDLNKIASSLSTLGEVIVQKPNQSNGTYERNGPGLMKSKSDHRLASQFRDQGDDYSFGSGRGGGDEGGEDASGRRKFRSRFMRKDEEEEKSVSFAEDAPKRTIRVLDTEDVARGPLSGIQRLYDCPRVIVRLQEKEHGPKTPKPETAKPPQAATPKPAATPVKKTSRQTSNDDEIDKIKKQNQKADETFGGATATSTATTTTHSTSSTASRPGNERTSSLRDDDRQSRSDRSSVSPRTSANHSPSSSVTRNESASRTRESSTSRNDYGGSSNSSSRKPSVDTGLSSVTQRQYPFSRSSSTSSVGEGNKSTSGMRSPRTLDTSSIERRLSRSNSTDSNKSGDGSASPKKSTGAAFSTDEIKRRFSTPTPASSSSTGRTSTTPAANSTSNVSNRYGSRFLGRAGTPSAEASKESGNEDEEEDSSDDSESEDSDESSEEEEEEEKNHYSDVGPLLGRSAQSKTPHWSDKSTANDSGYGSRYNSSDNSNNSSSSSSRYGASSSSSSNDTAARKTSFADTAKKEDGFDNKYPYASKYLNRSRTDMAQPAEEEKPSPFQSRFLNRSKSSAVIPGSGTDSEESGTGHGSSRQKFEELKERRQRLARSKSSAGLEEEDSSSTAGSGLYSSRYGAGSSSTAAAASSSASGGASGSANASGDEGSKPQELSNWARYLKNKYGNKTANGAATSTPGASSTSTTGASSSTASSLGSSARSESPSTLSANRLISRSRSSHLLGLAKEGATTVEDESKNVHATPIPQLAGSQVLTQPIVGFNGNIHRSQYLHKQRLIFKIGSRGSEEGNFTWPRGIAVGPDNSIVVADSSNHRVQVFDQEGNFVTAFGSYGSADGEFDCLAGVAVNRIGQFIIADRYNHRIQVFDPSGTFLRSFGSQGSGDGRFSYPWGVTTDALGFIYVCDKENHRIQVFQSDGSFVGKFGNMGNKEGQLEHPHYIAVSSTNRVIVSDSNNHRIQIFDVNGKVSETFGSEGADEGNFKFPRGVAVDEQGYIFVADSGNNRIQVFQPDGTFVKAFGCWGQGEGEFKGLEGVAVMSNGNILVCDRENHRVQVF